MSEVDTVHNHRSIDGHLARTNKLLIPNNTHTMTNTKNTVGLIAGAVLTAVVLAWMALPISTHAATYAYVDNSGEVKSVVASDWMTAIATAPNIYIHSGVMLLMSAADFLVIGRDVKSI